jgi:hypothetical protein
MQTRHDLALCELGICVLDSEKLLDVFDVSGAGSGPQRLVSLRERPAPLRLPRGLFRLRGEGVLISYFLPRASQLPDSLASFGFSIKKAYLSLLA